LVQRLSDDLLYVTKLLCLTGQIHEEWLGFALVHFISRETWRKFCIGADLIKMQN